ncbi:MAG: fibronectin type III domain-containing protein, partial [Gorillibacterium sp.]|nr:fibronectin type III domain-containing protein [Gorillibacterium sp.]
MVVKNFLTRFLIIAMVASSFFTMPAAIYAANPNLAQNGGFETHQTIDATTTPWNGDGMLSIVDHDFRSGSNAAQIEVTNGTTVSLKQEIELARDQQDVNVEFFVKTMNIEAGKGYAFLRFYRPDGSHWDENGTGHGVFFGENADYIKLTFKDYPWESTRVEMVITAAVEAGQPDGIVYVDDVSVFQNFEAPSNLDTSDISQTSISLTWNAPNNGNVMVGYAVYQEGVPTPVAETIDTNATITGLSPNTQYTFSVYSVANDGSLSEPSVITKTTLAEGQSHTVFTKLSGTVFGTEPAYSPDSTYHKVFDRNTNTFFDFNEGSGGYAGI